LLLLSQQRPVWVVAHVVTSDRTSPLVETRAGRDARCTTPTATTPRSARRSRSSWNNSVSNRSNSSTAMARLPVRATMTRRWSSRTPRGQSRSSMATLTLSPVATSVAISSMSSTMAPGTSRPSALSGHCAELWQPLHPHRERHRTTSGWRRRSR
jgi:hypothetical protein